MNWIKDWMVPILVLVLLLAVVLAAFGILDLIDPGMEP